MRFRREQGSDHFDLLPFIAILMCTLGCLLFVTLSVAAMSLGPERGEGWIPVYGDTGFKKTPVLLEWDGDSVVIHQVDGKTVTAAFDIEAFDKSPDENIAPFAPHLQPFMTWLYHHKDTYYPLIAIRPSGFKTMRGLLHIFTYRNINVGYEPLGQKRAIKLLWQGGL